MELKDKLTKEEIKLLEQEGVKIHGGKYTIDETGALIEKLDDIIRENLDENDDFTKKSLQYESIQDKILELEKEI